VAVHPEHRRRVALLLDIDPDLGVLLPNERRAEARRALQVAVHRLSPGSWNVARLSDADPGHLGLLIVDGVVARDVVLEDCISSELLGAGDVVRPWHAEPIRPTLRYDLRWSVLADLEFAVLDRHLAAALTRYPEVHAALLDRFDRRCERLAAAKAIAQLNAVDRRLLAVFWLLAERWGRVTGSGVVIPLTLSHHMLASLVGARRPTVTTALGALARKGEVVRRPDGSWLLTGEPMARATSKAPRFVSPRRRFVSEHVPEPAGDVTAEATRSPANPGKAGREPS
jgi:CRP/FNR family cyclic AMP-dependent transcriptional regulator